MALYLCLCWCFDLVRIGVSDLWVLVWVGCTACVLWFAHWLIFVCCVCDCVQLFGFSLLG